MEYSGLRFVTLIFATIFSCQGGWSLRLVEVRIPLHTVLHQNARLECHYDLEGESLYSVKWYKDGREFFRFVPKDTPPAQVFQLPGVVVDMNNSTASQVELKDVTLSSSGRYRCEVSGEAPSFQTVSEHGDMIVVALPDEGPRITGGRPRYQVGDTVRVNCTSGRSKPAAQLAWFINGEQANSTLLRGPYTLISSDNSVLEGDDVGLETSVLGLEFKVRPRHFRRGDMKLKCLATVATVYWRTNEESVESDRLQRAPVLESRATRPPAVSRADMVQAPGSSGAAPRRPWLSSLLLAAAAAAALLLSSRHVAPTTPPAVTSLTTCPAASR